MSRRALRSASRRRDLSGGAPAARRTAATGIVLVVLTVAFLALAGTTRHGIGRPVENFKRVQLDQRSFTCAGGVPGATAVHGTVGGGLAKSQPIGSTPKQFEFTGSDALGAFAGQQSSSADWLGWLPCPEPQARWWFVGAGAAAVTHDTLLTLTNPRQGQADVDINVFGPKGPVTAPGLHGITVPAGTSQVLDLAKVAPAVGDLAVSVVATRGLVAVSAADRFAPGFVGKAVQEWLPGQSVPATTVTIAGLPPKPDKATLVVVNPRSVDAIVSVQVIGTDGTFAPKDGSTLTVPPGSVGTLSVSSVFNGQPLALRVTSPQPVAAAVRTVTAGDVAFATGVRPVVGTTAFAVPGGTGQLVLSSLGAASSVQVTAFGPSGKTLLDRPVQVAKATSVGTSLPSGTGYVRLVAAGADVVAGFSVTDASGVASAGVQPAIRSVLLPVVRPGW